MKDLLLASRYVLDPATNVWARQGYESIAYSDGDEVEARIESVIDSASDRSVFSDFLRTQCVDWPTFYHLSSCRPNILRPFEPRLRGAKVLEIGAGCGAITRYLGEQGARVLALEGSHRRARIARKRTSDLATVEVVAENFESFKVDERFDVITLIGVLEYAPLFVSGDRPELAMLKRVRELLKDGGVVVLAIENKLGLKYFAGAPEDHIGLEMFGIESRYRPGQPLTFGYQELCNLLREAGFSDFECMSPLPDYKAAVSIITELGFSTEGFEPSSLAQISVERDRQLPKDTGFSLQRAWPTVTENGLGLHLANSFLVSAVASGACPKDPSILAYHYNSNRIPPFCKSTIFHVAPSGDISAHYQRLCSDSGAHATGRDISMVLPSHSAYVAGRLLSKDLSAIFEVPGWSIGSVADFVKMYLARLASHEGVEIRIEESSLATVQIPGHFFDLLPGNVIVQSNGQWAVIDREWIYDKPMTLDWFIFRLLLSAINTTAFFERPASEFENSRQGFVSAVFSALGSTLSPAQLHALAEQEAKVQSTVLGAQVPVDFWQPRKQLSGLRNAFDKARHLEHILGETREELRGVRNRENALREQVCQQGAELIGKDQQIVRLHSQLEQLLRSKSWRLTAPLRGVGRLGKNLLGLVSR